MPCALHFILTASWHTRVDPTDIVLPARGFFLARRAIRASESGMTNSVPTTPVDLRRDRIETFCKKWKIGELAFFGSGLRDDFREDSDLDFLATFSPNVAWGLLDHAAMERGRTPSGSRVAQGGGAKPQLDPPKSHPGVRQGPVCGVTTTPSCWTSPGAAERGFGRPQAIE